uniref:Uncharacterized protein n=1 Tax=Arundo donax TaxID=35708 RepID=A0A0A9EFR3_ARUDO
MTVPPGHPSARTVCHCEPACPYEHDTTRCPGTSRSPASALRRYNSPARSPTPNTLQSLSFSKLIIQPRKNERG